ncbi:unnamed protein product [Euphydryas editha]|uniref:Endonuclease/exonuclease/phosphatase domain-containing protein n=1 Tax=Euphydryas editha TaxID=104508 RepID=A0AAU9TRF0_EUPED|nr:unnamed protein product [Euphydryas editha]
MLIIIYEIDILNCTRTAKLKRSSPRPRSIVVQLSSPRLRDELLAASIKYNKGKPLERDRTPVFVCEHLSPTNKVLHAAARKRAKEAGYNGELFYERYVVYRSDRSNAELIPKKEGGGVLVAVSRRILSKRMYSWESKLEDLWVILEIPITHTLRRVAICAVYLSPPVHSSMLSHFIESGGSVVLDNCDCYCILGDFNLACIDWSLVADTSYDYEVPGLCQPLIDLLNLYELKQHNNVLNKSNRILDLVLSNLPACMVRQSHSTFSNIDQLHPPLDVDISFIREPRLSFNHQTFKLNFYKADFLNINKELQGCDWLKIVIINTLANRKKNISKNPKYFWAYVKAKRGDTSSYPINMTDGLVTTSDGKQICEMFASHFESAYINSGPQNSGRGDALGYVKNSNQCLTHSLRR